MGAWRNLAGTTENAFRIGTNKAVLDASGLTGSRTFTLPNQAGTLPILERAQTWTAAQRFPASANSVGKAGSNGISMVFGGSPGTTTLLKTIGAQSTIPSTANLGEHVDYDAESTTDAAAFTLTDLISFRAKVVSLGAGSALTNRYGLYVEDLVAGVNNYGLRNVMTAGAAKWGLYFDGGAKSHHSGNFLIGTTTDDGFKLRVNGTAKFDNTVTLTVAPVFTDAAASRTALGLGTGDSPSFTSVTTTGGSPRFARTGANNLSVFFDADAGQSATLSFRTGTSARWLLTKGATAETGSNAGSPLTLSAYDDSGVLLGTAFTIPRATQVVAFTQSPTAPTPSAGDNSTKVATTAYARSAAPNNSYRTILDSSCSITAGQTTGTYALGQGTAAVKSGTNTAAPPNVIYIDSADYPTVDGLAPKLRVRVVLYTNDVAPGATFVVGLHPVTRPNPSGAAGVLLYTIGAAVASSTVTYTTPAADGPGTPQQASADFALPANGLYAIGFVTSVGTIAVSAHVHISAQLQMRNN